MVPKYQQLAQELREQILTGKYASVDLLPTEKAFTEEYQVSRQTVRQALSLLVQDGLIEKRQGSGSHILHSAPSTVSVAPRSIAVLTTYISDYIFPGLLREAESVLSKSNCTTLLFASRNQISTERRILTTLLDLTQLDGLLIEGTKTGLPNPNLDLYQKLLDRGIPMVFMHGCYDKLPGTCSVLDDNYGGGYMLVKYLFQKGHRNIAGIFKSDDLQGHERYAGYADALRDLGLLLQDDKVLWYTTEDKDRLLAGQALEFTSHVLQALSGCSAVVCYNDELAIRLITSLRGQGVEIPKDLAVVSFDNSQYSELSPVRITSLSHGANKVGRIAAEMLLKLLDGESCQSEVMPWVLVEKESS